MNSSYRVSLRVWLACLFLGQVNVIPLSRAASIADGLVGHYKLDGDVTDSSASENHAVEIGGPDYLPGKIGQAINLNGTNQSADASDPPGLAGPGPKSIAVWFNQTTKVSKSLLSFGGFGDGILFELLAHNGAGVVVGHFYGSDFDTIGVAAPSYHAGQWHHAALTYDGTTVRVYLDGEFAGAKDLALDTADSDILNIGGGYFNFFNGLLDDAGLWNRELSPAEVQAIYLAGLTGNDLSQAVVTPVVVWIRSPLDGATVRPGSDLEIAASATTTEGDEITKVEFFSGETKIGETSTAPFAFIWNEVAVGAYQLTAVATDSRGVSGTSPLVNMVVTPAASVELAIPTGGTEFTTGADIPLSASITDPDGAVTKVEFFQGATSIGEATNAPYAVTWNNVKTGRYNLTAQATDSDGVSVTSAPIRITVAPASAPGLIIDGLVGHYQFEGDATDSSSSANHATEIGEPTYASGQIGLALSLNGIDQRADAPMAPLLTGNQPQTVSVWFHQVEQANKGMVAYGGDGEGHRFEALVHSGGAAGHFWGAGFDTIAGAPIYTPGQWHHLVLTYDGATLRTYLDGQPGNQASLALDIFEGTLHLGSGEPDGGFPAFAHFNGLIDDVGLWIRALSASEVKALFDAGSEGKDLTQAASPPQVAVTSPVSGVVVAAGESISITAAATVGGSATISNVEFFSGAEKIGEASAPPFQIVLSHLTPGRYRITAKATDSLGYSEVSDIVHIFVPHSGSISEGLVGHYRLDGNGQDSSTGLRHGSEIGTPAYVTGQIGQAIELNGLDQRLDAPDPGLHGSIPQSVSIWFQQSEATNKGILAYGDDLDGHRFEMILFNGVVAGHFWGTGFDTTVGAPPYAVGQWHHFVLTYDGYLVRSYLDGEFGNEKEIPLDLLEGPLHIGSGEPDGLFTAYAHFAGLVDDVGLWNRELNPEEIVAIYRAGRAGRDLSSAEVTEDVSLTLSQSGDSLLISWPDTPGFVLETAGSLNPPIAWTGASAVPVLQDGINQVTISLDGTTQFYRLKKDD